MARKSSIIIVESVDLVMSFKKCFVALMCVAVLSICLCGCNGRSTAANSRVTDDSAEVTSDIFETEVKNDISNVVSEDTITKSSFTNEYGTAETICAHSGCNSYIASSGDTNCCVAHSNHCLECYKYIDEDANWCVSCLAKAAGKATSQNEHYCEVCGQTAVYSIDGITGSKEYYCYTHYNEMKDLIEWMIGN